VSRSVALFALILSSGLANAQPRVKLPDTPATADKRLVVELFAAAPDIVQPIALDFDAKGRLLVVESHTHFRPAKYDGPKADRIRVLEDTDGDGKADTFTTFFEGLTHTMDLAVHPDGSVYVATRSEILRLRDTDGNGTADEKTRLMFLDTKGNYPHNGLCGLSFDSRGDLTFGMGENLGADYKLIGADGTTLTGGGEGGNVYRCTADGKLVRRIATGFWNPFGSGRDIFGRLFVVDNDPDASPPCRLLHVVEGGDYGFQFRYGRAGRHPFQAWNGELPGTLPMVAGTGESPCEVISYESDGLPAEYRGELLVPAWADHRVERYTLKPNGASFTAERKLFIQGGKDFYPSGLTVAPDGSLFVSDWGSRSYELHGRGAVWHVKWKDAKPAKRPADPKEAILSLDRKTREAAARELVKTEAGCGVLRGLTRKGDVRVRAAALTALIDVGDRDGVPQIRGEKELGIAEMAIRARVMQTPQRVSMYTGDSEPPSIRVEAIQTTTISLGTASTLKRMLADPDPFVHQAAVRRLSKGSVVRGQLELKDLSDPKQRVGLLLAWRASGAKDNTKLLPEFLKDTDPDVRLLAAKWVSDEKLVAFRPQVVEMLKQPNLDTRSYVALATTLARLDDKPVNEDSLAVYFLERLADKTATPAARLMALRAIPANHNRLKLDQLTELLKQDDAALRVEVLRALKDRGDAKAAPVVLALAKDAKQPVAVRAQALVTLSAMNAADTDFLIELVGGTDAPLRQEALRALVGAKLTAKQQEALAAAAAKSKEDVDQSLARVFAKPLNPMPLNPNRPAATDTAAWLARLDGAADPEAGRRVFEHPKLAACFKCHQVEGRGANVGPDLSLVGRTERKWIVESILQPTAVVAPHYQAWTIQTTDERTRTGLLVHTQLDESTYLDEKGNRFKVLAGEVLDVKAARVSIMPEKLLDTLTDQEIRDLVAYLASRK
jgi:putative membrane-bound dehydrogenase-like protein